MKHIVILGAGTGGTIVANMLESELNLKEWRITIIDRADEHHYQPGYLFLAMGLYGYEERDQVVRDIRDRLPDNAEFVQADIRRVDHHNRKVETNQGSYPYDFLILALGCHLAPEEVEGLDGAMGRDRIHTFYTLDGAMALQRAMADMEAGRLLVNIADTPIKCPVAPIEFCFLADYYFAERGVRDKIEITLVTPYEGIFTKPTASRILGGIAGQKGIKVVPNFSLESVDPGARYISSFEGDRVDYDLLCIIPPNLGPQVIEDSGLGDGTGYALTDPRTLKSRKAEGVYVIGDNAAVATSKAGSAAHFEAETLVQNLLREMAGQKPIPSYEGHVNCFIESGYNKALLLDFNYDIEPLPGAYPMPMMGPFSLLKETYLNHYGKIAFDWVYWNMLLPGHMAEVPLLPSQMIYAGKDLSAHPRVQQVRATRIGDIMRREVTTVIQGTAAKDAAALMVKHQISSLPVVDVDGRLIGILTEADYLAAMNTAEEDPFGNIVHLKRGRKRCKGTTIDDLMTRDPVTAREDESVRHAVELMDRNHIKRLPITDAEAQVIGILSRADLMKMLSC